MKLAGKRIALLVEEEYQELEVWYPYLRLQEEGAEVITVGSGRKNTFESKCGYPVDADKTPAELNAEDFDAVVVPGGFAPDYMRLCEPMIDFVSDANKAGKLIASICHGPWVLISAGVVSGKKVTGYIPIRADLENAGGTWVGDAEVVRDGNVITSRTPPDLPAFAREIIAYLSGD
jgi:protease I